MDRIKKVLAISLFLAFDAMAQQPQTQTAPIYSANAKYVQGVGPGYWPQAGSGLTLNLAAGRVRCGSTMTNYAGGTLTLANNTTNYIFLDTGSSCAPSSNTSGYTSSLISIATVVTASGVITTITDDRTFGIATPASSSLGTVTTTGSPASGNLAKFSGSSSLTNGDLSGDCATSGTLAITCTKTGGVSFATSATTDTTNATNIISGTLGDARLSANVVLISASSVFGAHTYDFSGVTLMKARVGASLTTTVNGDFGYDTTNKNWHFWTNAGDLLAGIWSTTPTNGNCVQASVSSSVVSLVDTGSPCGTGSGSVTTTGSPASGNLAKFSGASSITSGDLAGDTTTSGTLTTTTVKVNGVSYPASPSTHQTPVVTASNTATYKTLPDCQDSAGNHLNYTQSSDAYSCGTTGSASGGTASLVNDGSTGTTVNRIATTGTDGKAILPGLGNQSQMVGICTANCGTTGSATITYSTDSTGIPCDFDGATTTNDLVIQSPTTAGKCHDLGTTSSSTATTFTGNQMRVLSTNGGAGTYNVRMFNTVTGSAPVSSSPGILNQFAQWRSTNSLSGSSLWYTTNGSRAQILATGTMDNSPDFFCSSCGFQVKTAGSSDLMGLKFTDAPGSIGGQMAEKIVDNSNNILGGFGPNVEYIKNDQNNGFCGMGSDALGFSSVGTYARLQKISSTSAAADIATTAVGGAIGVADHGCFTIVYSPFGRARLDLDNGETVGDYLVTSTSSAGKGHSAGAVWPFTGQVIGQAYATNGGATTLTKYIQYGAEVRGGAYGIYNNTQTGQTSAVTDTTMVTAPATATAYRFGGAVNCTTSSAAATATLNLKWTDTSNTAQTLSVTATCTTLGAASVADMVHVIRAKASTTVTYGVSIANTPTFDVDSRLEAMGPN